MQWACDKESVPVRKKKEDTMSTNDLIGIGLYTPADAQRLIAVPSSKIIRWLRGHNAHGKHYDPLWLPQVNLDDGAVYLGFRDLMELRTAHQFISAGVSPQMVRKAIREAKRFVEDERPLSTTQFKTDGLTVFLEIAGEENDTRLLDLFKKQYAFKKIIERSLKDVEFEGISPSKWWVGTKRKGIVIDPERSFGQPIDDETGVPTSVLASAAGAEGSIEAAARRWCVPTSAVKRSVEFEHSIQTRAA